MYDITKCQKVILPQGAIYLGSSDENKSVGYLELNPHTSLTLHNRPAVENITQVKNKCEVVVFWDKEHVNILNEGDTLSIRPAGIWHIHVNPYDEVSLTYWDFDGDIRELVNSIKNSGKENLSYN
jgi:quercetin dioxygenase-like cupin family protein